MKRSILAFATFAAACAAQAGDFYIGGQYGSAGIKDWTQENVRAQIRTSGGTATGSQDSSVGFGRIFAGYRFNDIVGLELGYAQLGTSNYQVIGTNSRGVNYTSTASLSSDGFDISAVVTPFSAVQGLFFRAGVTQYSTHIQGNYSSSEWSGSASRTRDGTGYMLGVGYDWKLGPGALRIEFDQLQSISDLRDNDATTFSLGYLYAF